VAMWHDTYTGNMSTGHCSICSQLKHDLYKERIPYEC
jgi:hypothetical protein